jgi:ABC-type lipoprotein release transport system permease subunit
MSKYNLLFKFLCRRDGYNKYNWNLFFPFFGVIIGTMTVALTYSIMEGMEYAIFTKLEHVSFPGKLNNISSLDKFKLIQFLDNNNIQFQKGKEEEVMIINENNFRLVTIHGVTEFKEFIDRVFIDGMIDSTSPGKSPGVYIGHSLSVKMDLSIGDIVQIVHPQNINIITGLPNRKQFFISGIFKLNIIDYDHQHIFCQSGFLNNFIPNKNNSYFLNKKLSNNQYSLLKEKFPTIEYLPWDKNYQSFISAMKLEKFTYSIIGYIIVGIAGFTLMSMMSLSVMQKVPQIGILRALGMRNRDIGYIFMIQSIITSIISSAIGILLSVIIIYLDRHYHLIYSIIPGTIHFTFPLILKFHYMVLIFITSLILMLLAGIYPSIKAANLDPVQSISFRK